MAVVQRPPATGGTPDQCGPNDAEALFREAKRRERRRRLAWLGIVVIIVGALAAVFATTRPSPPSPPHIPKLTSSGRLKSPGLPVGAIVSLQHAGPLAVSPNGALYVADAARHEILVRLSDGRFGVVAGDGKAGYSGDGELATKAQLSDVSDITFAPNGDLYIADGERVRVVEGNGRIHTLVGDGGSATVVANGTPALSAALDPVASIAFTPSGQLYLATRSQLLRLSASDQLEVVPAVVTSGVNANRGPLSDFGAIAVDAQGNVYASSTFAGWSIFKISPDGVTTYLGYARRSGGNTAVVERGPGGAIEADDGPIVLRVQGTRLVTAYAVNHVPGIKEFVFMDYFALAPNGTLYADNLGPPAFEPYQQIVSVNDDHALSLWQGAARR